MRKLAWLKKNVVATYFFPALEKDPAKCYLPYFESPGKVTWGTGRGGEMLSPERFEYLFLDAEMRTALDYERGAAREGSLYCVEYVRPRTRETEIDQKKDCWPVYFAGYVFLSEEAEREFNEDKTRAKLNADTCDLREVLRCLFNYLQVGGERKYGWGLLVALEGAVKEYRSLNALFGREGVSVSVGSNEEVEKRIARDCKKGRACFGSCLPGGGGEENFRAG